MCSVSTILAVSAPLKSRLSIDFEAVQKQPSLKQVCSVLPVSSLSIVSTTNLASSLVKHIGGLNLSTFFPGPSVLNRIYSSLSLERRYQGITFVFAHSSGKVSMSMQAVQAVPFCTGWFLFLSVGYILTTTLLLCACLAHGRTPLSFVPCY